MKSVGTTFLSGLAAIVPIVVTLYLIYWLAVTAETVLGDVFRTLLPDGWYRPGMGLVTGLLLVFLAGLFMQAWLVQRLYGWAEQLLYRIPLIRSVYGSIRDLFNLFSHAREEALNQTVVITFGDTRLIGFVTRRDLSDMPDEVGTADDVVVYLPLSYMIGGYLVVVPGSAVQPVDIPVEDALRFVLTAGVTGAHVGNRMEKPAGKAGHK
jgi:uncharacterized membrane protein